MSPCALGRRILRGVFLAAGFAAGLGFAGRTQAQTDGLSSSAREQIRALLADKESRTPAQQKIDSNLLYAIRQGQGRPAVLGVGRLDTGVDVGADGQTVVDIVADLSEAFLEALAKAGGRILYSNASLRSVRAAVPLARIEALAAEPDVRFVNPRQDALTIRTLEGDHPASADDLEAVSPSIRFSLRPDFPQRAARVRAQLQEALGASVPTVVNRSEGDLTHRAHLVRSLFGFSGSGVKIGVLSNGVDSLAALQASGDLPAGVTVLPGQAGTGNEGAAMLEIVYDLAPDAQLFYATALGGITSFAQNIRDLRTAGCDIIIDDVFYFVETPFQKGQAPAVVSTTNGGVVIQAVNDVTAAGALFFSSAGNSGNKNDAQSGTWEGDFADGGPVAPPVTGAGNVHDFGGGVTQNVITVSGAGPGSLYWSDPLGGSANDYDLFVLNAAGTAVAAASTNAQTGTQDPYEQIATAQNLAGNRYVLVKRTGAANRFLHLGTNRARLTLNTDGETHGHSSAVNVGAYGVAATPVRGPFPNPFGPGHAVETFSSDGLRHYYFNADGSAITPGDFSATGGEIVQKPDVTAADGVSCAAPGFNPFFGTSAAAPHAGAIAGLLKSANPSFTSTQIRSFLNASAIDIEGPGVDRDSGVGILDAVAGAQATGVPPVFNFLVAGTTLTEAVGDGDTFVEPGECGGLSVALQNLNTATPATGITAVLGTSTPGVTIDVGTSAYADIAPNGTGTNLVPFRFRLDTAAACPLLIDFTLTVIYTGGLSPQTIDLQMRAGTPPIVINSTIDAVPPALPPTATAAITGMQNARLFRDGSASACGVADPFPGISGAGTRQFDSYTFQNCSSQPKCITVSMAQTSGAAIDLFTSAYLTSFDPLNLATNYRADAGASFAPGNAARYAFDVPAGGTFIVNVNEVTAQGSGTGLNYSLVIDGLCLPCGTATGYACCPDIVLAPGALPGGLVGTPYSATLTPSGGAAPYDFVVSGLPPGLSASPASGPSVTISGTPAATFSGDVTVSGTDANGCPFSQTYTLTITVACPPPPSATITTPDRACQTATGLTASVPDAGASATYAWTITNGTITAGQGTRTITYTAGTASPLHLGVDVTPAPSCPSVSGSQDVTLTAGCYRTLQPCRVIDTRNATGPYGGPALQPNGTRSFNFAAQCGVPAEATALALNVTVTGQAAPGFLTVFQAGTPQPLASVINFVPGRTRANNAVATVTTDGSATLSVFNGSTGTVQLVVDVVGYFK